MREANPSEHDGESGAVFRPVLVVEDSDNDRTLLSCAFEAVGLQAPQMVSTVADALACLRGEEPYRDRGEFPLPSLVIVDLGLPGRSGFELIREMRSDPVLSTIPIVVLTGSENGSDVCMAFRLGAQSYFRKPTEFVELTRLVSVMHVYWASSEIPSQPPPQQRGPNPDTGRR